MTNSEILQAKARAINVINGFITITGQQARDALKLAEALQEANRRLLEIETRGARPLPEWFDQVFGNLRGGG